MPGGRFDGDLLTKAGAAKLLGVSPRRVLQLRAAGRLPSIQDRNGVHLYERSRILQLAIERVNSGDPRIHKKGVPSILAGRVFEMFDQGWTLPQIVQETQQRPDVVRALYVEYTTPLGQTPKPAPDPNEELARHERIMQRFNEQQARRDRARGASSADDEP